MPCKHIEWWQKWHCRMMTPSSDIIVHTTVFFPRICSHRKHSIAFCLLIFNYIVFRLVFAQYTNFNKRAFFRFPTTSLSFALSRIERKHQACSSFFLFFFFSLLFRPHHCIGIYVFICFQFKLNFCLAFCQLCQSVARERATKKWSTFLVLRRKHST